MKQQKKFVPRKQKITSFAKSKVARYRRNFTRKRKRIHNTLNKVASQLKKDKLTSQLIQIEKDLQRLRLAISNIRLSKL